MGAHLEFYKVPKDKVPIETKEKMVMDTHEEDRNIAGSVSFFSLSLGVDNRAVRIVQLPKSSEIADVLEEYTRSLGLGAGCIHTSMVTSKEFIVGFRESALKSNLWCDNDEKSLLLGFLNDQVNEFDFDNNFLFYTYY